MKCPKCRFENPEGMQFCVECGNKLETNCPECGFANSPTFKFCGKCGYDLRKPEEPPPIDYTEPQAYTPKFLVDKILTNRSAIEGERKLVTVLFADVANFTAISEKLDPEEVHQIMDGCFKILMDEIHRYEGTINQFTGDGVMALFGAPVAHEDHAQRACYASLAMQNTLREYAEKLEQDFGIDFKMRMGLNSGPVIVGTIGDDLRMDYTAVGDTTNLAARMEKVADSGTITVSANTYKITKDFFEFKSLGQVQIKGKEKSQAAYELVRESEVATRIEAALAKGLTRFVGREKEMDALQEAFEKARSGRGQVVGIVGEAGVGKSRLLLELQKALLEGTYTYLEGRCLHYGGAMPLLPILDILRSYFEVKEGDREFVIKKKMTEKIREFDERYERIYAPFQELLSVSVDDKEYLEIEPREKQERTFEAVRDLFLRICDDKPLVVAVEDLHWMDDSSEKLLDYLIGWLANTQILLILLYRPEYTHQWGSRTFYTKIGVDQLSTETSAELVQSILEGGKVAPEIRELILSKAGGNPLYAEEITHNLLENGSIKRVDHKYVLSRTATEIQIPDTIQGIIAARLDRIEENLKKIMQIASVFGREFAFRILQTIMGMQEDLKSNLLNLQGLEFIYEKRVFPELEYIFKHALTQEVVYNSLLQKRRKEIHEKIAKAVEDIYFERLEEFYEMLAYHYSKSDNLNKACNYLKLSGNKATRNYSMREAIRFYEDAIEMVNLAGKDEKNKREKLELILLLSVPLGFLGFAGDPLPILKEGTTIAKELGDNKGLARLYGKIGNYYTNRGKPLVAASHLENCLKVAKQIHDTELFIKNAYNLFYSCQASGMHVKVTDLAPEVFDALEEGKKQGDFSDIAFAKYYSSLCATYAWSLGNLGEFKKGEALFQKGLSIAAEVNDTRTLGMIETSYGIFLGLRGDGRGAVKWCKNGIKRYEQVKMVISLGTAWGFLGYGYVLSSDPQKGLECIERGLKIQRNAGIEMYLSVFYWYKGQCYFDMGDLRSAQKAFKKALELSKKNSEKQFEGVCYTWLGRIMGKADQSKSTEAEQSILKGIKILEQLKIKTWYAVGYLFLGELYADTGQNRTAMENLTKAKLMFQEMGMDHWLGKTHKVLERL
ncbi:adenylate/guanylate cyclase domain-containing protein [Thermodesulfobacteriota bacterium]